MRMLLHTHVRTHVQGEANFQTDAELVSLLRQKPKHVPGGQPVSQVTYARESQYKSVSCGYLLMY
jgi:hypothetical protein